MTGIREFLPLDAQGRRRLKVAFVGTHGVGKTTLCFDLAGQLKRLDLGVDIVKEVARRCPLPINEETTRDAQEWILHSQVAEEIAAQAVYEVVICDRSVLDNYAYLVARAGRTPALDALVADWIGTYDALFKVPVTAAPSFDGTRAVSRHFQLEIDATLERLIGDLGVTVVRLDPEARDGWVPRVIEALRLPAQPPQGDLFAAPRAG
ncbi:MAG: ATP-binding protein [Gemmatimonadaceae bacterium]|nr:ATP-binding protein [Gemmatimonadaceae bacterium]